MIPQSILDLFHASKSLPFRSMTFFNFLLEATLAGSVLILAVLILRRVFRKQIGSRLVYMAWALVAVRLLLPVALPNPLMDELRPTHSTDAGARPVADQFRVRYHDAMTDLSFQLSDAANQSNSQFTRSLSNLTQEITAYSSYGWLSKGYLLCYVTGGLVVSVVFAALHLRFRRKLRKNRVGELEAQQLSLYQELCARMHMKPIPVFYADPLTSPCLVGAFKPMIALPLTLAPDTLSEALLHELNHYKARDNWWALLRCCCCAVHWFNPLIWIAQRFVKTDCELACDERVAAGLTYDERLHYANTLVATAARGYAPRAGVLATGMTMTGKRLKRRVNAILHMRAVRKVAATLIATLLTVMTVAAFSTAESAVQTARLTTNQSAFPFAENDVYPTPESAFGTPVALEPLPNVAQALAQAKRYLCALYPAEQDAIETQYTYQAQQFMEDHWEIVVWPKEGGERSLYYMELTSAGLLISINANTSSGGDREANHPSVLPDNLKDVLLSYGRQVSHAVLQDMELNPLAICADLENQEGRYVSYQFSGVENTSGMITITVQIAPSFRLVEVYNSMDNSAAANPPIERGTQTLVYTGDASIVINARDLGQTDSQYIPFADAALSVQQAFDIAVEAMLEKSGLSKEALLALPLEFGYFNKSNFGGDTSVWRFIWKVDDDPMNRYWIYFPDMLTPPSVYYSAPGEGLG